ncbi:MAG: hypothetical protein IJN94_05795 [Clostridia bacterium]|nr:hypothetical protein [Clostridia bacterium]
MKKGFNLKIYAAVTFFVIAGLLATITVTTYTSRYNGFSPEKTAVAFVQSIVETGDGYNAYKNTIVSKNYKYGDFIREYYMYPVIYAECDYEIGDDRDGLKGYNDDSFKGEKTLNDDGTLSGQVIDTMYDYYAKLMKKYKGWDNYDGVFTDYFKELCKVREEVFGDKYMTDEIMFTALESNVRTYGESLTGTEDEFDANTGIQTSVKTVGAYQKAFGEDYKFTYEVTDTVILSTSNAPWGKINDNADMLETYKTSIDDMSELFYVVVEVKANGKTIATQTVNVVKIKSTWYVENTTIDTSALYEIA